MVSVIVAYSSVGDAPTEPLIKRRLICQVIHSDKSILELLLTEQ
jgi:hypothetical protein